mmetsp:Transcript_9941/g.21864  ORF Transcript_9941/g.21864 Transcript_9941/m.21864 type:complete len:306 (-) Transcript_9941:112-1029(-)|eukprot:CAMPEP_0204259314 /NCGR_PEP_ID=MMETSP0468-20130131/5556_1 /ASSEMBLY_ACC=CAM_ASM_000383 /TAXON_ID=2969 /ORGANISM="Oxyrrhis marina" /LENGTH=305 /DNA_ID=CAMNT_0051233589 /DNA_START=30 /DNA_END=947 /DNA_ORIENTATION=+
MAQPRGMLLLEHLNLNVADYAAAAAFLRALGCQQAAVRSHMNCGPHTQFHMPTATPMQRWRGVVTIGYTAAGLAEAAEAVDNFTRGHAGVTVSRGDGGLYVEAPLGRFRLREGSPVEVAMVRVPTKRHQVEETVASGVLGIVEVEVPVEPGCAASAARFYSSVFGFETECVEGTSTAYILGGPVLGSQRIAFVETEDGTPYLGEHMCLYIDDLEGSFVRADQRSLVYVNPRFLHVDNVFTMEEAKEAQAFRIIQARSEDGTWIFTEEHEIRSAQNRLCPIDFTLRETFGAAMPVADAVGQRRAML